eukprot:UN03844
MTPTQSMVAMSGDNGYHTIRVTLRIIIHQTAILHFQICQRRIKRLSQSRVRSFLLRIATRLRRNFKHRTAPTRQTSRSSKSETTNCEYFLTSFLKLKLKK